MKQYIDKATVVAEIEKRIKETESMQPKFDQFWAGQISAFKGVLKILDILKAKEVDLEKEVKYILNQYYYFPEESIDTPTIIRITAKHFFELGLAQKEKRL